jgi:serine/threonine protein kinase
MASPSSSCPRCGDSFPEGLEAGDYEGICPRCLAALAVEEDGGTVPGAVEDDMFSKARKDPPPLKRGGTFRGMEVLEVIGQGGMGVVYKARQIDLDRTVALKVLSPRLAAADPEFPRRFAREAQALASLDHPNIVRVHEMGREADLCYLVMEHVDGVNLRELLVQKKLPPEQALRIVPQLCDALEYAHSRGVIHRDIKPENIILSRSGAAKIADFGLARIVRQDEAAPSRLTQTNVIMGTADYMAPEQRDSMKGADHRSDIYSLGVVLYEILTGELPVGRFDPPSRRARLDARVDDIVLRAIERDPERRYQRASHMGRDLDQVATSSPASSPDCPVSDLGTGKQIGLSSGRRLALRTVACPLTVSGWDKEEFGVRVDGDFQFDPEASPPLLQSQVETRAVTVFCPRGADLDVVAAEGSARFMEIRGSLSVRLPDGSLAVDRHDGPLRIHAGQGRVRIDGLRSEYFEVRSRAGTVELHDLLLARGRGQVETENASVSVRAAAGSSFRYYLETKSGRIEGAPSGQAGGGAGWLTVRTVGGDIAVSVPPPAAFDAVRNFVAQLTPRQVEKIGVYVIVNLALFIFFGWVLGTTAPAVCVAVFWGMALALELWKAYVQRGGMDGRSLSERVPGAIRSLMNLVPTPAPAPPAPPAPPKPRASLLAASALLLGVLAGLAGAGASLMVLIENDALGSTLRMGDAADFRIAMFVFGAAAFGLSTLAFILGWAASNHVAEARGLLKGRGAAHATMLFALLSFWAAVGYVRPHFDAVREASREAMIAAAQFVAALKAGDPRAAHEFLTDDLRASMPAPRFAERIQRSRERAPRRWKEIHVIRVVTGAGLREATAWVPGGLIRLRNRDGWRISDLDPFMMNLPERD